MSILEGFVKCYKGKEAIIFFVGGEEDVGYRVILVDVDDKWLLVNFLTGTNQVIEDLINLEYLSSIQVEKKEYCFDNLMSNLFKDKEEKANA